MSDAQDIPVTIRVSGPNVQEADVREVGEQFATLLNLISEAQGGPPDLGVTVGAIKRICDGCDTRAPSYDMPPGWLHAGANDYCPDCLIGGRR